MEAEGLPFLVVHGGWFWIVLVVGCSGLLLALMLASSSVIRLRLARRKRRETLSWLRQHCARELAEGQITLAGRWNGDAIDAYGERIGMADWRGAWLRDARIDLGEPVLVTGNLRRDTAAGDGNTATTTRWWLVGAIVYRDDPEVKLERVRRGAAVVLAAVAALVAYTGLRILGDRLADGTKHREYLHGDGGPLVLTNFQSLSIAASLPGSRDDALDALASALKEHPYRDEASVERQRDLARLQDGPCAAIGFLTPSGRYDEELELAHRCHHTQKVFAIELAKGDFARAWADRRPHLDWPLGEGMIAIANADWSSAAETAERMAKVYDRSAREHEAQMKQFVHMAGDGEERERTARGYASDAAHRFRCLSKWFRALGGDSNASQQLRALAADPTYNPLVCAPIVAQTLAREERVRYLIEKSPDAEGKHNADESIIRTLLWIEGQEDPRVRVGTTLTWNDLAGQDTVNQEGFLLGLGTEAWRGKKTTNYILALEADTLLAVQRGDFPAAHKLVGDALAATKETGDDEDAHYARYLTNGLASVVALRAGDMPGPNAGADEPDGMRVRRGEDPRDEMKGYPESCDSLFLQARISAQAGDGRPLATAMQSCNVYWTFSPQIVLGVLPLVKQGRTELATALRWWSDTSTGLHEPFSSALRASLRRDMARMVGDSESAERWGSVAAAFAEPLKDPTRRMALVLWDM